MRGLLGIVQLSPGNSKGGLFDCLLSEFSLGRPLYCDRYESADHKLCVARLCRAGMQGSSQPARSANGRWMLFLNGELYNEDLLANNQAQAVLDAYVSEGEELFVRLNGSYALLLIEPAAQRLRLICDRSASQPIFYLKTADYFAFSSRLKPFRCIPNWKPKISRSALAGFLASGYHLQGRVLWDDVAQLGPGQMLTLESKNIKVHQYWDFTLASHRRVGDEVAYTEELARLLRCSIARRSRDGDRLGVLLSGGYDSRAIAGIMKRLWPDRPLQTITWGEEENKPESDALIAKQLSGRIGTKHEFFKLNGLALPEHFRSFVRLDEGRTDAVGNYPESLTIFKRIREALGVEVLLRGDECFGWKEDVRRNADMLHSLEIHELAKLMDSYAYLDPKVRRDLETLERQQLHQIISSCPYAELHDRKDHLYYTLRLCGYLNPLSQLKQIELDLRNPFLDNEILDFVSLLPEKLRLGKALFKATVKGLFPEFEAIGFAKHSSLIDWDQRLGHDSALQEYLRAILLEKENGFDAILDRRELERFLDRAFLTSGSLDGHEAKQPNTWRRMRRRLLRRRGFYNLSPCSQIFRLTILKIWVDEYMNGDFALSG
ncbi:MAG TPA: asparagine synthase-related protein [bacterium]|jgi:asparagine synthetase B (glutamine-hydrolysing)